MNNKEVFEMLKEMGIPVTLNKFDKPDVPLPFIIYNNNPTDTFKADDLVYSKQYNYIVFLCSDIKNTELEENLETIFNKYHMPYDKDEDYIDSEKIYQVEYTI